MQRPRLTLTTLLVLFALRSASAQIEVPQDRDLDYYINELYKVWVESDSQESVRGAWKDFLKKHTYSGYCFDLYTQPVYPRVIGDSAAVLDVGGRAQLVSIVELAPGKSTKWHSFGYDGEPLYFIVQGRGYTEYYSDRPPLQGGMPTKKYEWSKGALIAIPPDHKIRHVNLDSSIPARMLEVVGYGINLFPYVPEALRVARENPAEGPEERARVLARGTYVIPFHKDLRQLRLHPREARGNATAFFDIAAVTGHKTHPNVHVSQLFREKAYAHKHGGQPMFVILQGKGYDIWSPAENLEQYYESIRSGKAHRSDYKEGTLCGVPAGPHWHQHFSTDPNVQLRYLAIVPRSSVAEKEAEQ